MSNKVEKALYIIFGGISGVAIGEVMLSIPFFDIKNDYFIIMMLGIMGVLSTLIIILYRRQVLEKESQVLRNETVALITHEMRTSLTSTSWALYFVLNNYDQFLKPEDKKMIDDAVKSIHTTVMHTVNLLDVSLLDIGKLSISLNWQELEQVGQMLKDTIEKYNIGAQREQINLTSNVRLDPKKKAEIDNLRLRVILENLLENAIQYTKGKDKKIHVDINNNATTLNIVVSDNGIGIPRDEQAKIFEEFYRASNARKKLSSGSGIGLHMCNQYVKAHHGTIRFESEEGKGSTFIIAIPLKTSADVNEFLQKV